MNFKKLPNIFQQGQHNYMPALTMGVRALFNYLFI